MPTVFHAIPKKQPVVPNRLFFAAPQIVDLSEDFGDAKKKKASVRGLLHILHGYKFTIAESTPVEQEIALDPELLGNVFENLLASYNPETGTNARRQTGSFYTPRPIVDYMVDESLKAYLADALVKALPATTMADAKAGLEMLFAYTEKEHAFSEAEIDALITAINACNILDPACGSGAYPMGILHKLVFILGKLDPHNEKWRQRQVAKAEEIEDVEARASSVQAINNDFANNALDYGRKLYLIENCIYGADIQPIAIQISKLRFFISLICDQRTHSDKARNLGVRPLPNLETKFVAANTLLGLNLPKNRSLFENDTAIRLEKELEKVRHRYFSAQTRKAKLALQKKDRELTKKIIDELKHDSFGNEDVYRRIAWNPYDHHSVADFFDPGKMFGPALDDGFDVVIGNPPYVQIQKFTAAHKAAWVDQKFKTYTATADIYCLFYERGVRLLKDGGQLSYITSNKWMRAGYGEKLRDFFCKDVAVEEVIDFGGVPVFNAAMVDTAIVRLG
jgi:adenine-specific DNA-methyltransferase